MRAADAATIPLTLVQDGERVMRICNACRYCEGFCAVFPAIERRLVFAEADLVYLANLCHNCGECLYSCQYAPPHEFAVNVPRLLSTIRQETFRKYAWPGIFAGLFTRNGLVLFASAVLRPRTVAPGRRGPRRTGEPGHAAFRSGGRVLPRGAVPCHGRHVRRDRDRDLRALRRRTPAILARCRRAARLAAESARRSRAPCPTP